MLITSNAFINEDMRLQPGDRFRVYSTDPFTKHDNTKLLNGEWLTVLMSDNKKTKITTEARNKYIGHAHEPVVDLEIEARCNIGTNFSIYWWEMDAVEVADPSDYFLRMQKTQSLPII